MAILDDRLKQLNQKCDTNNQSVTETKEQIDEVKQQVMSTQAQLDYVTMMSDVDI